MNTQLLEAAVLSLEATALIVNRALNEARKESSLKSMLNDVLSAVKNEIEKDDVEAPVEAPAEAEAPAEEVKFAPNADALGTLVEMLGDPRYTLRSFKSIKEKTGLCKEEVCHLLDAEGYDFVVLTKRDSDEQVVGFSSRN